MEPEGVFVFPGEEEGKESLLLLFFDSGVSDSVDSSGGDSGDSSGGNRGESSGGNHGNGIGGDRSVDDSGDSCGGSRRIYNLLQPISIYSLHHSAKQSGLRRSWANNSP